MKNRVLTFITLKHSELLNDRVEHPNNAEETVLGHTKNSTTCMLHHTLHEQ